jgi:hypothetical protein
MPVTMPVEAPTDANAHGVLHVPPPTEAESVCDEPTQTAVKPEIVGFELTVTTDVALHPETV